MAYGVSGMYNLLMEGGAGIINAKEALENSGNLSNKIKTIIRELSWIDTYGDDPRDNEAIKLGVEYYYKL